MGDWLLWCIIDKPRDYKGTPYRCRGLTRTIKVELLNASVKAYSMVLSLNFSHERYTV